MEHQTDSEFVRIPRLQTARLVLRAHVESDFNASAAMWGDEQVLKYFGTLPATRELAWSRFVRYAGHWQIAGFGYWVVADRDTDTFLGEVGFADYRRDIKPSIEGLPEAGWVFNLAAHGRGYAHEAVKAMIRWGDQSLPGNRTVCIMHPEHAASFRLAQAMGYETKGMATYQGNATCVLERLKPDSLSPD